MYELDQRGQRFTLRFDEVDGLKPGVVVGAHGYVAGIHTCHGRHRLESFRDLGVAHLLTDGLLRVFIDCTSLAW